MTGYDPNTQLTCFDTPKPLGPGEYYELKGAGNLERLKNSFGGAAVEEQYKSKIRLYSGSTLTSEDRESVRVMGFEVLGLKRVRTPR